MRKLAMLLFQLIVVESFKKINKNEKEKYFFDPLDIKDYLNFYFLVVSLNLNKDKIFLKFNSESSFFKEGKDAWFKLDGIPLDLREKGTMFSLENNGFVSHFKVN